MLLVSLLVCTLIRFYWLAVTGLLSCLSESDNNLKVILLSFLPVIINHRSELLKWCLN